jgi:hypothetical protein
MEILFSQENTEIRGFLLSLEKIKIDRRPRNALVHACVGVRCLRTLVDVQGIEKTAQPFSVYRAQHS